MKYLTLKQMKTQTINLKKDLMGMGMSRKEIDEFWKQCHVDYDFKN